MSDTEDQQSSDRGLFHSSKKNHGPPPAQNYPNSTGTPYTANPYDMGHNDFNDAAKFAQQHSSDHDSSLFSSALSMLSGKANKLKQEPINESEMGSSYQYYYGNHNSQNDQQSNTPVNQNNSFKPSSDNLGAAAAIQALKMFNSDSGSNNKSSSSTQSQLIGLAMAQAAQLFDKQSSQNRGQTSGFSKQDVVAAAAQMALKMYLKNEMSNAFGGNSGNNHSSFGGGSGGGGGNAGANISGLLNLASKFMK